MENRTPLFLLALVILGAAIVGSGRLERTAAPQQTLSPAGTENPESKIKPGPLAVSPPTAVLKAQCKEVPPPLLPLCERFFALNDPIEPEHKDWTLRPWVQRAKEHTRFLIVTIPDPEETRDLLSFDRAIESIQTAAESRRYQLDQYWIPWIPQASLEQNAGEQEKPKEEPGMLLFGKGGIPPPREFLVVFLVGESPLSGIRSAMFRSALYYQKLLLRLSQEHFYIAGPNYSGSFPSLAKAIMDTEVLFPGVQRKFLVISPSATVRAAGEAFRNWGKNKEVDYASIVHNDDYAIGEKFQSYIRDRWGYNKRFAVLSESGTVFGASLRNEELENKEEQTEGKSLRIQFPRQIARLRNAYPDPTRDILLREESQPFLPESKKLPVPMRDARFGKDAVPTFATKQVPVSQEAVLLEISAILERERTEFVHIVSTDVFDSIFLCSYLRRACPEARLFEANADMMSVRSVESQPLEGILSVTTFPLFLRNQFWAPRMNRDKTMLNLTPMASRSEFGVYNACLALLRSQSNRRGATLLEYDWKQQEYLDHPPLWLTVIGTNGYWPIAFLDDSKMEDSLLLKSPGSQADESPDPGYPTRLWSYLFWVLVAGSIIFCVLALGAQFLPDKAPLVIHRFLAKLKADSEEEGAVGQAFFLLAGSLFLGMMVFIMASPVWVLAGEYAHFRIASGFSLAAVVLALVSGIVPFLILVRRQGAARILGDWYSRLGLSSLAFVLWFAWLWWTRILHGGTHNEGYFFAYRSLDLVNGVSPVLPLLLLAGVILLLSCLHARRHTLHLKTPRILPWLGNHEEGGPIARYVELAAEPLTHPFLSRQGKGLMLLALGLSFICFLPWARPLSLESLEYDLLYHISFRLVVVIIVLSWARFLLSWFSLRRLLDLLDRHPLKEAFARIPTICSTSPILPGKGSHFVEDSIRGSARILNSFLQQPLAVAYRNRLKKKQARLQESIEDCMSAKAAAPAYNIRTLSIIHNQLREIGDLIVPELEKFWQARYVEAAKPINESNTSAEKQAMPPAISRGEEFVALQYSSFVGMILKQLRNLLYFVTTGFFLAIVSTLVYPFRAGNQFMWVETIAFITLGAPVMIVLMQVETNEGLRKLTAREKGNIGRVILRLAAYGALPLLGLISSHFPALGSYLMSLLQPAVQALR